MPQRAGVRSTHPYPFYRRRAVPDKVRPPMVSYRSISSIMSQLAPSSARDCGPIGLFFFLIEGSEGDVRWPPKREPMRCQHAIRMSWEHGGWGSGPHHASYAGAARGTNWGYLKLVSARQSLQYCLF